MENFFLNLNALDELKLALFKNFKDEKIFVMSNDENLTLELSKNHVVEKKEKEKESVKALVLDFKLFASLEKAQINKPIYLIFDSLDQLLNAKKQSKNFFYVFSASKMFGCFSQTKKAVLNYCSRVLFAMSHKMYSSLFDEKLFYSSKIELETVIRCIEFFKKNSVINLYNYFELVILLKKLITIGQNLSFDFFDKVLMAHNLLSKSKTDETQLSFLLIWLESVFLKSKNYFSLRLQSFEKRIGQCRGVFGECLSLQNDFNFFEVESTKKVIKGNLAFLEKELGKLFFLSSSLINIGRRQCCISASSFLGALSLACDCGERNIFQFMKNLGYLNGR